MSEKESETKLLQLLAEIAFAGASKGLVKQVTPILDAIKLVRPKSAVPAIGTSLILILQRRFDQAAYTLFEEGIKRDPEDIDAKAVLGLVLHLGGRNAEAEQVLEAVLDAEISSEENSSALTMARQLLDQLRGIRQEIALT